MSPIRRRGISLDTQTREAVLGLVFTGGTALAGLILVFLGAVFTSYDSYQPDQQTDVAAKCKRRALLSLIGFLSALEAAFPLRTNCLHHSSGIRQKVRLP